MLSFIENNRWQVASFHFRWTYTLCLPVLPVFVQSQAKLVPDLPLYWTQRWSGWLGWKTNVFPKMSNCSFNWQMGYQGSRLIILPTDYTAKYCINWVKLLSVLSMWLVNLLADWPVKLLTDDLQYRLDDDLATLMTCCLSEWINSDPTTWLAVSIPSRLTDYWSCLSQLRC